ncbi:MAG: alpha-amylase [Glaciihabitans sp.]|nr:alpha-amylase [Glaciihabitans sp.]
MNQWTEHVVWWHVYPLGFLGADTTGQDRTPEPRLRNLVPWLDHLLEIGANGLALGPVFTSSTHGYDTIDFFTVDPRLGTRDDLVYLIDEAHSRGIRVMLDGVFNHVGREFPALVSALADPTAPEAALFGRDSSGAVTNFEGHGGLVAFDHGNPDVADLVTEVMNFWLDAGADAWRLDAAYSVPNAFWATVLPRVRGNHPDVFVLGEVLHGDYTQIVAEATLDSVTQYELWQGVWHGLQEVNLHELNWALTRHNGFLETFVPYTFIGNHDVTRIASQIDDERHHPHALVLLMTLGGMPSVYYGDEYGYRAIKEERFGGDDAIRPAYPVDAAQPVTAGLEVMALHQQLIGIRRRHPWLHRATSTTSTVENASLVYTVSGDGQSLTVAINLGDSTLAVPGTGTLLAGAHSTQSGDGLSVGAHGWAITEA